MASKRAFAAIAVLTAALVADASTASRQQLQQPPAEPRIQRVPGFDNLQAWLRIVRRHAIGTVDDAARQAATLTPIQQQQIIDDVQLVRLLILQAGRTGLVQNASGLATAKTVSAELRGRRLTLDQLAPLLGLAPEETDGPITPSAIAQPDSPARRAVAQVMVRAMLLHTDVAMASPSELPAPALTGSRVAQSAVQLNDGRETAVLSKASHYSIAREAVALVMPAAAGTAVARQWYFATIAYLQAERNYSALLPHLDTARIAVAADPRTWLWSGAALENLAAPVVQVGKGVTSAKIESPALLLARAEDFLRHALELDAACAECTLRLARVRQVLGKQEDAAALLARAEPKLTSPLLRYYAAMFTGRSAEALEKISEARAAYERAMKLFPQAQSPRLALADLAFRDANQAQALSSVRTMFVTTAANPDGDPWWYYDVSVAANWATLVADMRQAAVAFVEGK